jgi:four helix bundle protein
MRGSKKYDVWIDSMELVNEFHDIFDGFPDNEKYGLRSQIGPSVVSIPSHIAEGVGRKSEKELARFIEIAIGSSFELET